MWFGVRVVPLAKKHCLASPLGGLAKQQFESLPSSLLAALVLFYFFSKSITKGRKGPPCLQLQILSTEGISGMLTNS